MTPHPLPFINLCHLHTNIHSLTHTQADTYASMQYLQLSLSSPAWTPSITLSPPPPASSQPYPSFSSFPPHLCTLASSLSNPPFHFFPGLTSRLAWKGKKKQQQKTNNNPPPPKKPQLYVHMMQCVSTWVSNFVCVWTWAAVLGASGRESMCSEGGACVWGVCALLSSCTHASMSECVQDRGEWRCGGGRGSVGSSDQGCGFYTARGSKPQQAQRWLTSQPLWPQNCCFSSSVFHQHNLPEPSTHQFSSFYSTTPEYI